jgi:hypothetical protein
MRAASARPPQSDRERRAYFDAFAARFPELILRWGNTFARWRDVPGTELVIAYYITNHSVGVAIRGQRGVPVRDTAATLPQFSLETALGIPMRTPDYPFVSSYRFDPGARAAWPKSHDWLHQEGERYLRAVAEIVGGLDLGPQTAPKARKSRPKPPKAVESPVTFWQKRPTIRRAG